MLRDKAQILNARNEELNKQVEAQQTELMLQKESVLREKKMMVAKLEMLDDSSDVDPNEKDLQSNLVENEEISNFEKKLEAVQSALDKERGLVNDMAIRKEELEKKNLELKQCLVNEQMKTLKVGQDLEETKENVRQLKEELHRTAHMRQEVDFETMKMKSDLQALEQNNSLLQNQLASLQNDMTNSTLFQQKLKQELEVKVAEKVLVANEVEELRQ